MADKRTNLGLAVKPEPQDLTRSGVAPGGRMTSIGSWAIERAQTALNKLGFNNPSPPPNVYNPPALRAPAGPIPPGPVVGTGRGLVARREPWMGPGIPQPTIAPKAEVAGRQFDFPVGYNLAPQQRRVEGGGVSFEQLRALADSLDIVRLCIETRKDQMSKLTWSILPRAATGEQLRPKADDRCRAIEAFLRFPDRKHSFDQWQRMVLEDHFVLDAPSVYQRRTQADDPYSLDVVDGATINPLLDNFGREPDAPAPAYQQRLKGMPAVDYTRQELLYFPRNPRANKVFGMSVVEQIVLTVNIAIRREVKKLNYFTENNIPDALVSTPLTWTPDSIAQFQTLWDALLKSQSSRGGMKFVPGGMTFMPTTSDGMLMGPFDEWIARVVCFAFSLPPTAFVQQQNRATAETANDTAMEEGLAPLMVWWKNFMDRLILDFWGYGDLEFHYDEIKDLDPAGAEARELEEIRAGLKSIDEVRAARGLDPLGMGPAIFGIGPGGIMFVDDLLEAKAAGLLKIQPPPPPQQFDAMGNPIPPDPAALGAPGAPPAGPDPAAMLQPDAVPPGGNAAGGGMPMPMPRARPAPPPIGNPTDGIPADILAAVGLGPGGPDGAALAVTRKDEVRRDPGMAHVPNKQVLAVLRAVEAAHRRK